MYKFKNRNPSLPSEDKKNINCFIIQDFKRSVKITGSAVFGVALLLEQFTTILQQFVQI